MLVRDLIEQLSACNPNATVGGEWFSLKKDEVVHGHPRRVVQHEDDPLLVTLQGIVEDRFPMKDFDREAAEEIMPMLGGATHTA
jgi:hypothetical protein